MIGLSVAGQWYPAAAAAVATLFFVAMAVRAQGKQIANAPPVPVVEFVVSTIHERVRDKNIAYVHNIGGSAARNVDIAPVTLARGKVRFRSISLLKPEDRVPLPVENVADYRGGFDVGTFLEQYDLPREWWLAWLAKDEGELTFAFIIRFRDGLWRERTERQTVTIDRYGVIHTRSKTPRG